MKRFPLILGFCTLTLLSVVALILRGTARGLACLEVLPWDAASHALDGLKLYNLLILLHPLEFLGELLSQVIWTPLPALMMIPFYGIWGPNVQAASLLPLFCWVLSGTLPVVFFSLKLRPFRALLASAVYLSFFLSSRVLMRFANYVMWETPGALITLLAVMSYWTAVDWRLKGDPRTSKAYRWTAIFTFALLLTKLNYGIQWGLALVIFELLLASREELQEIFRKGLLPLFLPKPLSALWALQCLSAGVVALIAFTGGGVWQIGGSRISLTQIANPLWVLYIVSLLRWGLLMRKSPPVLRPELRIFSRWFLIPFLLWWAYPVPNRFKVLLMSLGVGTRGRTLTYYLELFPTDYLLSTSQSWVLAGALALGLYFGVQKRNWGALGIFLYLFVSLATSAWGTERKEARMILNFLPVLFFMASWGVSHFQTSTGLVGVLALLFPVIHWSQIEEQLRQPEAFRTVYKKDGWDMCQGDTAILETLQENVVSQIQGSSRGTTVGLSDMHWVSPFIDWELNRHFPRFSEFPRPRLFDYGYGQGPQTFIETRLREGKLDWILVVNRTDSESMDSLSNDIRKFLDAEHAPKKRRDFVLGSLGYPATLYFY